MSSRTIAPTLSRRTAVRLGSAGLAAAVGMCGIWSAEAQEATTFEANKALVHRIFEEAVNGRTEAVISELYAPDFVDHGTWARQMPGPAGMPLTIDQLQEMFPDVAANVEMALAEDDLVATVAVWRGTHPPAGTHVVGRTMHVFRIANGQIVEEWSTGWDWLGQRGYRSVPRPRNPLAAT